LCAVGSRRRRPARTRFALVAAKRLGAVRGEAARIPRLRLQDHVPPRTRGAMLKEYRKIVESVLGGVQSRRRRSPISSILKAVSKLSRMGVNSSASVSGTRKTCWLECSGSLCVPSSACLVVRRYGTLHAHDFANFFANETLRTFYGGRRRITNGNSTTAA